MKGSFMSSNDHVPDDEYEEEPDEDEKRIMQVFATDGVPQVTEENLLVYRQFLLARFDKKRILTGREDFPWEEKYVMGVGDRKEYEKLKKTMPSYTDEYELMDIREEEIEENDLIAHVKRLADGKRFDIGLSWLTTKVEEGKDYQLLDDFATWVVNW
jgi:hypothetical protein